MAGKTRRLSDFQDLHHRIVGKKEAQEENVIPMINVIFLLLLYFMVVGNLDSDHNIAPPISTQFAEPPEIPTLSVGQDGKMWLENQSIEMSDLKIELSKLANHKKLKIHADGNIDALTISRIMDVSAEVGILKFILVTQQTVSPS